jgi:DNA-binding LacI/PurR family transcriptional regulator
MAEVTMYDVAKKAGVSVGTISNVINFPARVRPSTLKHVLTVIDELGFVPKTEALARARKNMGRIGVLAPFSTYVSFEHRLRGVMHALQDQPFELVLYDQQSMAVRNDYLSSLPISKRLDGLIVMAMGFDERVEQRLLSRELETVLVDISRPAFSRVETDNFAGGRLAAEYLIAKGHRRCAFIGEQHTPVTVPTALSTFRQDGFRQTFAEAGIDLPAEYISLGAYGMEQAQHQAHTLLSLPEPPTAIFAYSDIQAIGVLEAARERGLSVPDDLAVIGFDDLDIAQYLRLTTIRQPLVESGQVAVQLLLDRLRDPTCPIQSVILPLQVVERSTA